MNRKVLYRIAKLWCLAILITSCKAQQNCNNCGVIIFKVSFFNPILQTYVSAQTYWADHKIWYKDSIVIEQIMYLYINKDVNGIETRKVVVGHYTFVDMPSRSFYNYTTFSDTAHIIKKYTQPDTVSVSGGSNLFMSRRTPFTQPPQVLTDTTINNIAYRRVRFINENDKATPVSIGYFRCDKKGTMFQFDKSFSEKIGCPMVRIDFLPTAQNLRPTSGEIEFASNKLTTEELKVFAAWEKNAKQNPVNKQ